LFIETKYSSEPDQTDIQFKAADHETVIVNELPYGLPVDDAELTMLEMHIGDIVSVFANLSE
jgi:hypothetical protein